MMTGDARKSPHPRLAPRLNPCREEAPADQPPVRSDGGFFGGRGLRLPDAPPAATVHGLRDRAILSVGLQAGARRAAVAWLRVKDFHQDRGQDCLPFVWKGGERHALVLHAATAQRIREYFAAAGPRRRTTKLYDHRGRHPARAATVYADYSRGTPE